MIKKRKLNCLAPDIVFYCEELVAMIGSFGDWSDLLNTSQVSKTLQSLVRLTDVLVTLHTTSHWQAFIASKTDIRKLKSIGLTDEALLSLCRTFRPIQHLDFNQSSEITDHGLSLLPCLSQLQYLHLAYCEVTDISLPYIGQLLQLQSLDLTDCGITDAGLPYVQFLVNLRHLVLDNCWHLTTLEPLRPLLELEQLSVKDCSRLTDDGVQSIGTLPRLLVLDLSGCYSLSDNLHFEGWRRLQKLVLSYCTLMAVDRFQHENLLLLDLGGTSIADRGLEQLGSLKQLQALNLNDCSEITDQGLHHLRGLIHLRYLNLNLCSSITDAGLCSLETLPALTCLDLGCCEITDVGLKTVQRMTQLQHVDLTGCSQVLEIVASMTILVDVWDVHTQCYTYHFNL